MPPRHAPTYAPAPEKIVVPTKRVACDGGGGALGHPLVYLEMGDETSVECAYCDREFVLSSKSRPESEYLDPGARTTEAH